MPEIGPTLREARMRAKIDITEVEQATKIRAKYLRAIENEEWGLLPGATFTKSFIRSYADFLGIDGRHLVEEFKFRYEDPNETDVRTVSPALRRDRRPFRGGGPRGGPPRWAITTVLVAILLAALFAVGSLGGEEEPTEPPAATAPVARRAVPRRRRAAAPPASRPRRSAPRTVAAVRMTATADLYVCLVDDAGAIVIPGTIYSAGETVPVRRGSGFRLTLGNSNVELHVNGKAIDVPPSAAAIGYAITPAGARTLPADQLPTCA